MTKVLLIRPPKWLSGNPGLYGWVIRPLSVCGLFYFLGCFLSLFVWSAGAKDCLARGLIIGPFLACFFFGLVLIFNLLYKDLYSNKLCRQPIGKKQLLVIGSLIFVAWRFLGPMAITVGLVLFLPFVCRVIAVADSLDLKSSVLSKDKKV
ncbi:MAG: hypothetical protein JST01_00725 [Cyanobacteria bacterium SZAS TMP-1]|nr:hypothetical protein [Cyanobacteria bacterium SZAS TMP-1]